MFLLLLDSLSCFDRVLPEHVISSAYFAGTTDQTLLLLDGRLCSWRTYVKWDEEVLGPIEDRLGLEQGGCTSDRLHKLTNNEQLKVAQNSGIDIDLGPSSSHKVKTTISYLKFWQP